LGQAREVVPIVCESRIEGVTVHQLGAVVSRRVVLPATISDGEIDLEIPGITALFDDGSLRAELSAPGRTLMGLHAREVIPAAGSTVGPSVSALETLQLQIGERQRRKHELEAERATWASLGLRPRLRLVGELGAMPGRISDALAVSEFLRQRQAELDAELARLSEQLRLLEKDLQAARVEASQARSGQLDGSRRPERQVTLRLTGDGPIEGLLLRYVVQAARWWPVYTLRMGDSQTSAEWLIEAQLAQRSGEDWTAAQLSLSTADLVHDARLPELPALRLGRAQSPPRRGYRPAPDGLTALFAGYERAFGSVPPPRPQAAPAMLDMPELMEERSKDVAPQNAPRRSPSPKKAAAQGEMSRARSQTQSFAASMPPPAPAAFPSSVAQSVGGAVAMADMAFGGAPGGMAMPPEPASSVEPAEAWLDFDRLVLADNGDVVRRGRLTVPVVDVSERRRAVAAIEALYDVVPERGQFDHVFIAEGRAEVPSDGLAHRALVSRASAVPTMRYRAVPREAAEVYRQLTLGNPFPAPLLGGPVEVYLNGQLVSTAPIAPVDRGGTVTVGLGVEDRLKIARRAAHEEHPGGLLGGASITETTVTVTLRSSLGQPVTVSLFDRIPVSDDDALEVKLAKPGKWKPYDQAERQAPVRGGLTSTVEVPAGAKAEASFTYALHHSAKSEIVGGNRRD